MYVTPEGDRLLVIDGHVHFWDARPENRRNRYGLTFIESFWGAHVSMTPELGGATLTEKANDVHAAVSH